MTTEGEQPADGWYWTLQEAATAALAQDDVELNAEQEIVFIGRKRNPIHEFAVELRQQIEGGQMPEGTYRGVSSGGIGKGFRKAAKDAEGQARADLEQKGQWPPAEPITYKADMYVRIGNPIHEFVVELTQQP